MRVRIARRASWAFFCAAVLGYACVPERTLASGWICLNGGCIGYGYGYPMGSVVPMVPGTPVVPQGQPATGGFVPPPVGPSAAPGISYGPYNPSAVSSAPMFPGVAAGASAQGAAPAFHAAPGAAYYAQGYYPGTAAAPLAAAPGDPLANFDVQNAPIPPLFKNFMPYFPPGTELGVQILADVASIWFNRVATDPNSLLNHAIQSYRQRTNREPSGNTLARLRQIVNRVTGELPMDTGVVTPPVGTTPPATGSNSLSFTVISSTGTQTFQLTGPQGTRITSVSLEDGGQPVATPPPVGGVEEPLPPPNDAAPAVPEVQNNTVTTKHTAVEPYPAQDKETATDPDHPK